MRNVHSFEHEFLGFGIHPSKCIVEIRDSDSQSFITFLDINEGTSVTNASEQLANEVRHLAKHSKIRYFERYIREKGKGKLKDPNTYDEILYEETNGKLHAPTWKFLTEEAYQETINNKITGTKCSIR